MFLIFLGLILQVNHQVGLPDRTEIFPSSATLKVGQTMQFSAKAYDKDNRERSDFSPRWHLAESSIALVDKSGAVKAIAPGRVVLVVVMGGEPGYAEITVEKSSEVYLHASMPSSVILSQTSMPIHVTANGSIPEDRIRYKSRHHAIAKVDKDGRVHGKRPGSTVITVETSGVKTNLDVKVHDNPIVSYQIAQNRYIVRQGDVVRFRVRAVDAQGEVVDGIYPQWEASGGEFYLDSEGPDGVFVAEEPRDYTVTAHIGEEIQRSLILRVDPRVHQETLSVVGRGAIAHHRSGGMWAFEGVDGRDYAYVGTVMHNWMKVFDITHPEQPIMMDSLEVDAQSIVDVNVHDSHEIGVIIGEDISSQGGTIVLLDLSNPAHPTILSEYREMLTGGIHNVWLEQDLIYACHNSALHIIDISDPLSPEEVGRWELNGEDAMLHDVIVLDGYAYVSHGDHGVVILDVGRDTHGGTAVLPVMVSRFADLEGHAHVAWRYEDYLFVGNEMILENGEGSTPTDTRGFIEVLDVSDIESPHQVARYEVDNTRAHHVWVEEYRLYVGDGQGRLRVVDISGQLRGNLYQQGREIALMMIADDQSMIREWPMTRGAQVFKGHIYISDLNSGLWVTRMDPVRP